jgi:biotin carboxyl carrier protein
MPTIEVECPITGTVWKVLRTRGDRVAEDEALLILESMKMEIPLTAPEDGVVEDVRVSEGDSIAEGQVAIVLKVA